MLAHPALQPYIWGGKGIGSQGDGTAQLLCKDELAQARVRRKQAYLAWLLVKAVWFPACGLHIYDSQFPTVSLQVCEVVQTELRMTAMPLTIAADKNIEATKASDR